MNGRVDAVSCGVRLGVGECPAVVAKSEAEQDVLLAFSGSEPIPGGVRQSVVCGLAEDGDLFDDGPVSAERLSYPVAECVGVIVLVDGH